MPKSAPKPGPASGSAPRLRNGVIRRGKTWSYVIRVTDVRGVSKPRWVGGFSTEVAAKRARDEARIAASTGVYVDRTTVTVEDYLVEWLVGHAVEVKPRTRAGYAHLIETYVVPRIGGLRLQAVKSTDLSRLYRDLLEGGGKGGRPLSGRSVEYSTRSGARRSLTRSAATSCCRIIVLTEESISGRSPSWRMYSSTWARWIPTRGSSPLLWHQANH